MLNRSDNSGQTCNTVPVWLYMLQSYYCTMFRCLCPAVFSLLFVCLSVFSFLFSTFYRYLDLIMVSLGGGLNKMRRSIKLVLPNGLVRKVFPALLYFVQYNDKKFFFYSILLCSILLCMALDWTTLIEELLVSPHCAVLHHFSLGWSHIVH